MNNAQSVNVILLANIKRLRRKRHISQGEMAEILGMSKQNYYRIESGKQGLRVELLPFIAEQLYTNIDELFGIGTGNHHLEHSELLLMSYVRKLDKGTAKKIFTLVREVQTRMVDESQLDLVINILRQFQTK